ncbi:uncharacterized protein LOC110689930 [Chenopodium quinoa]|uniref:uncharacterized protein LOC110689930 n=1 Tax=Chenopodium quinoa TaxID=63459 RepID=UPI000B78350D|nr:uncharacterized protein LOC110689930 [Chenopodium quinoa]
MVKSTQFCLFAVCLISVLIASTEIQKGEAALIGPIIRALSRLNFERIYSAVQLEQMLRNLLPKCTVLSNSTDPVICPENDDDTNCVHQCNKLTADDTVNGTCLDFPGFKPRCFCSDLHHCYRN